MTASVPGHDPRRAPRRPGSRRRAAVAGALLVAAVALALVVAHGGLGARGPAAAPVPASAAASPSPPSGRPLFVLTDRTVKLRLLDRLRRPPQLLIFGGSRATRFEPAFFRRLTGLRGFNLAFQNGRPEDAWAFLNLVHQRWPHARLHVAWFLHVEAFREQGLSAGLVEEPRLRRWFPAALVARERRKLPRRPQDLPAGRDLALTRYAPDGHVLRNRYDLAVARGRPLSRALDWAIAKARQRYATTAPLLFPRSARYFEKTLRLANRLGPPPVVVLMPLHPRLLAAVREHGWAERHRLLLRYLRRVQRRTPFFLLDLSDLRRVPGADPDAYYDGFHVTVRNARAIARAVVRRCPQAFR